MATCEHCPSQKARSQNRLPLKPNRTRPSQQRYAKAPKYAGQQSFDLKIGLLERPVQSRKRKAIDDITQPYKRPKLWLMDCPDGIAMELDKVSEDNATEELRGYVWCNTCYASSRTPITPDAVFDRNDTPSRRVLRSIQSVQNETKQLLLAIGTTEAEFEIELEALRTSLTPGQPCIMKQTRLALALCKSLLSLKFDFFKLSRAPGMPSVREDFHSRYAMSTSVWQRNLKPILDLFRHHLYRHGKEVFSDFLSMCDHWLRLLRRHVPDLKCEWDMIEENIRKYVIALKADGIGVPDSYFGLEGDNCMSPHKRLRPANGVVDSCPQDHYCHCSNHVLRGIEDPPMSYTFQHDSSYHNVNLQNCTSNCDLCWSEEGQRGLECSNTCHPDRQDPFSSWDPDIAKLVQDRSSDPRQWSSSSDSATPPIYNDAVLAFMSGWLHYGSRIARSVHAYYKVFAFCAWAGGMTFLGSQA